MQKTLLKITKFIAICSLAVFISCEKDLYEEPIYQSKIKVSYANTKDLEQNILLMNKISKSDYFSESSIRKKELAGRIIYDTITGYFIDTDHVRYIEGEDFNSYTFVVMKPDNTLLDNLVLMSTSEGDYKAYAMRYTLTEEERLKLNTEENIDFTNKCKVTEIEESESLDEIFTRMFYDENCNMQYSWQEVATINPCTMDGCWDPMYTTTSYSHTLVGSLVCTSGGGGGTSEPSTIGTSPHGGAGGGGFDTSMPPTPCNKLKDLVNVNKGNIKPIILNDLRPDINNNASGEKGAALSMNSSGAITPVILPPTTSNTVGIPAGGNYYCGIHTHPLDTYPMFSWSDIDNLQNLDNLSASYNVDLASFLLVCKDDNGVYQTYAMVFNGAGNNPITTALNDPANAGKTLAQIKTEMDVKLGIEFGLDNNYERAFLRFIQGSNVSLYRANSTLTNWTKLTLSNNTPTATVNRTNCN